MSDVSPLLGISGLSFDSTLLSSLSFFCLVLLPYLIFFCLPVLSSELFPAKKSKSVNGMYSVLLYGTGICCYAFIKYFLILYCFCPFLLVLYTFLKSRIDKSTEWIPVCMCLMCFFFKTGVILKGLILQKFCVRCLCFVLCKFVYRTDFAVFE